MTTGRVRIAVSTIGCMLAVSAIAMEQPQLRAKIVAPTDDDYLSGPVMLRAEVEPADVQATVTFFADGHQVCSVARRPYQCEWDAGPAIAEHQLRLVATTAGARAVHTVATKGVGYAESVDVELVQVTASVTDGRNRYVKGLPKASFHVYEDGQPQAISHFASEDVPLNLVVAIDVSGSMIESIGFVKAAVKEFLGAISPRDQVTLVGFNDSIFTLTRKATEPAQRIAAVDRLAPWGGTALYDVLIAGLDMLGHEPGRKAILVFTDGEDEGSHASLADAERRLQASDVTLYMVGQGRGVKLEALKRTMTRLAAATGGRALITGKPDELRAAFASLLAELSNQYLLGYTPTNSQRDGTLRRIKVEVDGHHEVRAREAYRASAGK